ncbi:hypothetical protein QTO34_011525 [Cnephaeus nilssonii]|uniref:TRAF3 interacting protein 3 n=1 Tax=Cnephaeus nilssonii TaxID=3371016 RepID=A0AA40LEL7_CNENI|nr:hypothetical protein QTO34_011525 [Eptesicus nilssonii]
MISPDPRPPAALARWAESYEAKYERRQETRESRRCRPNMTTCRQVGKALRTQHAEQLQRARQQQFFRRRNLEVEEKDKTQSAPDRSRVPPGGQARRLNSRSSWLGPTGSLPPDSRCQGPALRSFQPNNILSQASGGIWPIISPPRPGAFHTGLSHQEATQTPSCCGVAVLDKEIIQLSEYLKEALQRELVLKQKMVILQDLLSTLIRASDSSWKGQLNEDKLKGKLRSLENQLYTCTQKYSPWGMKKVLMEMEDQKNSYEQKAKESLQKVLEEKMSAEQQLQSTQRSLAQAEQKCEEWRSQYEALKEDWRALGTQHRELESQLHVLQSKLQGADSRDLQMNQALRLLENEHQELQAKMNAYRETETCAAQTHSTSKVPFSSGASGLKSTKEVRGGETRPGAKVQQLQSLLQSQALQLQEQEKLLIKKGVLSLTGPFLRGVGLTITENLAAFLDQALSVRSPKPSHNEVEPEGTGKEKDWDFRDQLQKKTLQLQAKEKECRELHSELDNLSDEYLSCLRKLQHCREDLNQSQQLPPGRQCGRWLSMLILMIAIALAVFLANKDSLII